VSSVSEQRESGTANDLETVLSGPQQAARRGLGTAAARRIALAAQGFARSRPQKPAGGGQIRELIGQLGLLQLDSVNVFCRSHYMPVFSRLGAYDCSALDLIAAHIAGGVARQLIEYWAREASLIPIDLYPLLRWRMGDALVARVDLKSDRKAGLLLVQGAFAEEGTDQSCAAGELAAELRDVATWLGLSDVIRPHGVLAAQLAAAIR
jgi:uncharacterized protein YcaQ